MDQDSFKQYHSHEFDPKDLLSTYCLPNTGKPEYEEIILFPVQTIKQLVSTGKITGTTLIDYSTGPFIAHLLQICDHFRDIIILETNDITIKEMEKWKNGEKEAFEWFHLSELFKEMVGDRKTLIEKEASLRGKVKNILKCDLNKEKPTGSCVLPKADCLMCFFLLGHISKDKEAYCENIKKLAAMIKLGGHLLLVGTFNGKYFSIGEHKIYALSLDEEFIKKAVEDAGFTMEYVEKRDSKIVNVAKYDTIFLASAVKIK